MIDTNTITTPADYSKATEDDVLCYFTQSFLSYAGMDDDPHPNQYYCGITNDIPNNLNRHHVDGYTACAVCDSFATASSVEEKLGKRGFDIGNPPHGGNGGKKDSVIVYMIRKTAGFIQ